jgi:hypothetical protein
MYSTTSLSLVAVLALAAGPVAASTTPVEWTGNGHYYEVVSSAGITWPAAKALTGARVNSGAMGLRGYLATITTADEDLFIDGLRQLAVLNEVWVGGSQLAGSTEPGAGWTWENDEGAITLGQSASPYANWLAGEPNDQGGNEQHLGVGLGGQYGWNDEGALGNIGGYVVEYEVVIIARDDPAPGGANDPIKATSGIVKNIDVLGNDTLNPALENAVTIESHPGFGTAVEQPDNSVSYTPHPSFEGTDTFEYRVTDENGAYAVATVTVTVSASEAVVEPGSNQLFFNQALNPAASSNNPMTAGYQHVLAGGEVTVDCCRVLDTREGAGIGKKYGSYLPVDFDLGMAVSDTHTNPSCSGMPEIPRDTAILRPWQRGVPATRGLDPVQPAISRENDLGVCLIRSNVQSKGVVFSVEEAKNVLGYKLDCQVPNIDYRPFTGGVSLDPVEVDAPYVTRWTADCDESRSAKRYSDNLMVVNLWHDRVHNDTQPYLARLATAVSDSIAQVTAEGCVENYEGFLTDLQAMVQSAKSNMTKKGNHAAAVNTLDDATRLALLIGPDAPAVDPYASCPGNAQGLFVGRLMSLKFAACSELQHPDSSSSSLGGACMIAPDIFAELPPLPGFPSP